MLQLSLQIDDPSPVVIGPQLLGVQHHCQAAVSLKSLGELLHRLVKLFVSQGFHCQIFVRAYTAWFNLTHAVLYAKITFKAFFGFCLTLRLLRSHSWGHTLAQLVLLRFLFLARHLRLTCNKATSRPPFVHTLNCFFLLILLFFLGFFCVFFGLAYSGCVIIWLVDVVDQVVNVFFVNLFVTCLF